LDTHAEADAFETSTSLRMTARAKIASRMRALPVISWVWPQRHSAGSGAGCGLVGGACCVGGAVVKGVGIASVASVSSFVDSATPYFIGASIVLMLVWAFWMFRQVGFNPGQFAPVIARHGVVMVGIYGATLGTTMLIASTAGLQM